MALNVNQFRQSTVKGQPDLQAGVDNIIACVVGSGQATALVAGQTVIQSDVSSHIPTVTAAVIASVAFGVVIRNLKDQDFPASSRVEVARSGTVVYMEASAAIAAGADVQYNPATHKIATKTSTNGIVGQALDKATADGDLIRVVINPRSGA